MISRVFNKRGQNDFVNYTSFVNDLVNHTDLGTTYNRVQILNGGSSGRTGVAKSVAVMPGDAVTISAYGK